MNEHTPDLLSADELIALVEEHLRFRPKRSTLAAWRCRGDGPPFMKLGRNSFYPREQAIVWAMSRVTPVVRSGPELRELRQEQADLRGEAA